MKSPFELKVVLRRQWETSAWREARLLGMEGAWPILIPIGRPSSKAISANLDGVKRHVMEWRQVPVGEVLWEPVKYRATTAPVDIPLHWKLRRPSEWIEACADAAMRQEFAAMVTLVEETAPIFHASFVRQRSLWREKPLSEVVQAARLAMALAPGCAEGKPLRMLSIEGIDTKFFERHARLVTALLDVRFDGEVSRLGLEVFLGALTDRDHWLLVMDLDGSLLPFQKLRVRSSELRDGAMPGKLLLIVENECCQHHLPALDDTIAVLGAGFDLNWTEGNWLATRKVAYWGDIDTWGLQFLGKVRQNVEHVDVLMMTAELFEQFSGFAVREPIVASTEPPTTLCSAEQALYTRLLKESSGRLEQEFLPENLSRTAILRWAGRVED